MTDKLLILDCHDLGSAQHAEGVAKIDPAIMYRTFADVGHLANIAGAVLLATVTYCLGTTLQSRQVCLFQHAGAVEHQLAWL